MFELTKLVLVRPVQKNIEYLPISQILEFHPERDIFHNAQSTDCDRRSYCVGLIEVEEDLPDPGADSHQQETEERVKNPEEETGMRGMDHDLQ